MDERSRLRILDANRNRVAEGLRVAEDVARFHWAHPSVAERLKAARHAVLRAAELCCPLDDRLRARDAVGDVGKEARVELAAGVSLERLFERNLERAREAVRVLEEVSRGRWPDAARAFESVRYDLYDVEKASSLTAIGLRSRLRDARICLLATSDVASRDLLTTVAEALEAGVEIVQLREKSGDDRSRLELGRALRDLTRRMGALLVVNDRPDIALLCEADGVHLGQGDLPLPLVRRLVGAERILGVSTHSVDEARRAEAEGADYIGIGPVFRTDTKDAGPPIGPAGFQAVRAEVSIPTFAIGGVGAENLGALREAGVGGIAVSAAILRADNVAKVVTRLLGGVS